MNTISILISLLAVCYSLVVAITARNYRNEVKREYDQKAADLETNMQKKAVRAIGQDIYITFLKEKIKKQANTIKLLTPTEPDGN